MRQARKVLAPTNGRYLHAPVRSFNECERVMRVFVTMSRPTSLVERLTQEQAVERLRRRNWRTQDNMIHPFFPGQKVKVMVHLKEKAVKAVHPLGTVYGVDEAERAGWYSPAAQEKSRQKTNAKMPVGQRRLPPPVDTEALSKSLLKAIKALGRN